MLAEAIYDDAIPMVPQIALEDVPSLVSEEYGLNVEDCRELRSYSDRNFLLTVKNETQSLTTRYVLKVLNGKDSRKPNYIDGQNQLLLHLNKKGINCPLPVRNRKGELQSCIELPRTGDIRGKYNVRLLTYVSGEDMSETVAQPTPDLMTQIGLMLGKVCNAVEGFTHPGYAEHESLFDPGSIPSLKQYVSLIDDNKERALMSSVVDEFCEDVVPQLGLMNPSVIHGDMTPTNMLVAETKSGYEVTGIIDVFDTTKSFILFELAICLGCVYQIFGKEDILSLTRHILKGYRVVRNLSDVESRLLKISTEACLARLAIAGMFMVVNGNCDPEEAKRSLDTSALWRLRVISNKQFMAAVFCDDED